MDEDTEQSEPKRKQRKMVKVKNKMPAPVQITAEQLLREAKERELELIEPPPVSKIANMEELRDFQMRKRKDFEDNIRKNRTRMGNWLAYASWEESQKEIQRARSVYERALDVDHRHVPLWLRYAEMEMRNKQVNHARNIYDRAVTIMPRANQAWYKYVYMEEVLGNVAGARQVFERWMDWMPDEQAWHTYVNFELRYKEISRARAIYERFVMLYPDIHNWVKYARFEEKNGYIQSARRVYERAIEFFGDEHLDESLAIAFARFEERQREFDRAKVIYNFSLEALRKASRRCDGLQQAFIAFQKKFGDRRTIDLAVMDRRRARYDAEIAANRFNYDAWFDLLRMLESDFRERFEEQADEDASESETERNKALEAIREAYEQAIANVPPLEDKRAPWRRYVYFWIYYAVFEELTARDVERTRQVYETALRVIPHRRFTFAKLWLLAAQFEIRNRNVTKARKLLGQSLGLCPKAKLFAGYIELEIQLREFDRCRKLYEKFLEFDPSNATTWMKYAELEAILGDAPRARAIYELAVTQPKLNLPELVWKAYMDFEIEQSETANARALYRRLLQRTKHVKVYLSFAQFELSTIDNETEQPLDDAEREEQRLAAVDCARNIYREANEALKANGEKEERVLLLETWRQFELDYGTPESTRVVQRLMPERIKRRVKVTTESGEDAGWEEHVDYLFPDTDLQQANQKLLSLAKLWKAKREEQPSQAEEETPSIAQASDSNE